MKETEIGNCGSKSINKFIVKEQQVNGSLFFKLELKDIRYTLMGFKRNYQIRILSNQLNLINTRLFTSKAQPVESEKLNTSLNHWTLSGFIDGEASFIISVIQNNKKKLDDMLN